MTFEPEELLGMNGVPEATGKEGFESSYRNRFDSSLVGMVKGIR